MKVLDIGATGTIGKAVVAALKGHEVVQASHHKAPETVDITNPRSIRELYARVGKLDAVVCVAGGGAWKPLAQLTDADFASSLGNKLMGQVNVIRYGFDAVRDGGSLTVIATAAVCADQPSATARWRLDACPRGALLPSASTRWRCGS